VLDKTTSESRASRDIFFADPEQRISNRDSVIPFWYVRRVLFWFGVHNWTEMRREKLHPVGMDHDPTQEMIVEICCLLDGNAIFLNGPR
jgi:hypothetical protein